MLSARDQRQRGTGSLGEAAAPRSRRHLLGAIGAGGAGLLLAACGAAQRIEPPAPTKVAGQAAEIEARFATYAVAEEPNGDLARVVWPDFIAQADPELKALYAFQITHGELMRWMPCFCGCGQSSGHRSNRDCYVKAVNPDGSVQFDTMAPT